MSFMYFSSRSFSGITAQNLLNAEAGNTIEFIQNRVRFATSISNSPDGNILTLGFDTNYSADSDGDGIAFNDRNYFEQFQFVGVNSTNYTACSTNRLIYIPNASSPNSNRTLIPKGVRNLPGWNIFTMTNKQVIAIIRFGIVDSLSQDHYQAVDVQGTGVALNRFYNTNVLTIPVLY